MSQALYKGSALLGSTMVQLDDLAKLRAEEDWAEEEDGPDEGEEEEVRVRGAAGPSDPWLPTTPPSCPPLSPLPARATRLCCHAPLFKMYGMLTWVTHRAGALEARDQAAPVTQQTPRAALPHRAPTEVMTVATVAAAGTTMTMTTTKTMRTMRGRTASPAWRRSQWVACAPARLGLRPSSAVAVCLGACLFEITFKRVHTNKRLDKAVLST